MNIIIYESSSKGGIYDYSAALFKYYARHFEVESVEWVIPSSTDVSAGTGVHKILCNDRRKFKIKLFSKAAFLIRHFSNPVILFLFILKKKKKYVVILNDFEQLSVLFWFFLYRTFLSKQVFAVYLHDPDRDAYPPSKWVSEICMKLMMSLMKVAFFHEQLPVKNYYKLNARTKYVKIPFGYYPRKNADPNLYQRLLQSRGDYRYVTILGNIRSEKNYELAINSLPSIKGIKLLVAGSPSTSSTDVSSLESLVRELRIEDRVTWIIKYLSEEEMAAVIDASDLVVLNYKSSFKSQSAILNSIADHKKKILVSRTQSGLTHSVEQFKLGILVEPDNLSDLIAKLPIALEYDPNESWEQYMRYASWENHVDIAVNAFKEINN